MGGIHPGGRRIIEESQNGLGLTDEQAKYSWAVLSEYGNMLSPSVMFVMEKIMKDHEKARGGREGLPEGHRVLVLAGRRRRGRAHQRQLNVVAGNARVCPRRALGHGAS